MKLRRVGAERFSQYAGLPIERVREEQTYDSRTDTLLVPKSAADVIAYQDATVQFAAAVRAAVAREEALMLRFLRRVNAALTRGR